MEESIITILKELVSRRSDVSSISNEKLIADYIFDYLTDLGTLKVSKQFVEGDRYNIIAVNSPDPEIVLFGHMDSVPLQDKNPQAISPRIHGNKFYGLGAVDMKAGLSVMLYMAKVSKNKKLGYIFTVDEEYEFKGAKTLIEQFSFSPKTIINLEPTDLKIVNGCRGIIEFTISVEGRSAHASRKSIGINAIEKLVELAGNLEQKLRQFDVFGETSVNIASLSGGTLTNNQIVTVGNFVPNFATATFEIRLGSKTSQAEIFSMATTLADEIGLLNCTLKSNFELGSMFTEKSKLKLFEDSVQNVVGGVEYKDINETGFYEVQMLQEKSGCDVIVFGPGPNEKSHTSDEYVEIDSIYKTLNVVQNYCGVS